jgi:hypothetical protein
MNYENSAPWHVEVETHGRCGLVIYHEGKHHVRFDWEFCGGDTVAIIWGADAGAWDRRYPWAAARQPEVLGRVASEVVRQKAPTCRAEMDVTSGYIYVRTSAA